MDEQKNQNQPIRFKKPSIWKKFLGKKWAFPAIYIGTAAIIVAFVMWFQGTPVTPPIDGNSATDGVSMTDSTDRDANLALNPQEQEAVAVSNTPLTMTWPVAEGVETMVKMGFFDEEATKEEQEAALVRYENSFNPHTGIDLVEKEGKSFDVIAALDGKVLKVANDPLVGNLVEIEHADNIVTVYQSLENVTVKSGDEVSKGQVIGKAGRNVFEQDAGTHLHFEVRVDGKSVNPEKYLGKPESR